MKLNKKGFTLVELLAVIVVLALLMVVATSSIGSALNNSKKKALQSETQKLLSQEYKNVQSDIIMGTVSNTDITKSGNDGDFNYKIVFDSTGKIKSYCVLYASGKLEVTKDYGASPFDGIPNIVVGDVKTSTKTSC